MCEVSGKPDIEPDYDQIDDEDVDIDGPYLNAPIKIENGKIIILCWECSKPATLVGTEGTNDTYCQKCYEEDQNLLKTEIAVIPLIIQNPEI